MVDSTNSIQAISGNSSAKTATDDMLTEKTRRELESYGVNTSKIKTETEGQRVLKEVKAQKAAEAAEKAKTFSGNSRINELLDDSQDLARRMGVYYGNRDSIERVLENISLKISEMKLYAGENSEKLAQVMAYESEYNDLYKEFKESTSNQTTILNSLSMMSNYTKIALGM